MSIPSRIASLGLSSVLLGAVIGLPWPPTTSIPVLGVGLPLYSYLQCGDHGEAEFDSP